MFELWNQAAVVPGFIACGFYKVIVEKCMATLVGLFWLDHIPLTKQVWIFLEHISGEKRAALLLMAIPPTIFLLLIYRCYKLQLSAVIYVFKRMNLLDSATAGACNLFQLWGRVTHPNRQVLGPYQCHCSSPPRHGESIWRWPLPLNAAEATCPPDGVKGHVTTSRNVHFAVPLRPLRCNRMHTEHMNWLITYLQHSGKIR